MKYDVLTIGHLLQDVFLLSNDLNLEQSKSATNDSFCFSRDLKKEFEEMTWAVGGTAANIAVSLAYLKFKTALVAKVGNDLLGRQLKMQLKQRKVSTEFITVNPRTQSGLGVMLINKQGEKTSLVFSGAAVGFGPTDIPLSKVKSSWIYISSLTNDLELEEKIMVSAKKKGSKVAFNPGRLEIDQGLRSLLPLLRQVDLLVLNRKEANLLMKVEDWEIDSLFDGICVTTPGYVAITDGQQGAYLALPVEDQDRIYFAPALAVATVDNTGAGDAFSAGLLAGLLKNEKVEDILRLATLNASGVVREIGAQSGLLRRWPTRQQLDKIRVTKM